MCNGSCCSEWSSGDTNEPVPDELGTRGMSCDQDGGHAADDGGGGSHGSQRGKLESFSQNPFTRSSILL